MLRDRWVGERLPAFERDCSPPERWAVYVFSDRKHRSFHVVGRLLQRPWSRVGGSGAHAWTPRAPAASGISMQFPSITPFIERDDMLFPSLFGKGHGQYYGEWANAYDFSSLAAAREKAQRLADTVCPLRQSRLQRKECSDG